MTYETLKIVHWIFYNSVIYWCIALVIITYKRTGQITPYVIVTFVCSSLFYSKPYVTIFTNLFSAVMLIGFFEHFTGSIPLNFYNYLNLFSAVVFSSLVSISVFSSFVSSYLSKLGIEKANKRLIELENSKADYFVNISHELKTPLNILYSSQQMMENAFRIDNFNEKNVGKYIRISKQNINRLNRLINNIIDINKIESSVFKLKFENVDLVMLVEDIVHSAVSYCEDREINLLFDTNVEELVMACDPDGIERVVLNLLSNSIKYSKSNSTILVEIEQIDEKVYLSVKDEGEGIPKDMTEKVFDRYSQVEKLSKDKKEGSGIGLALVKSIVELHGGQIALESEVGIGTEVTLTIPTTLQSTGEVSINNSVINSKVQRVSVEFSDIYH